MQGRGRVGLEVKGLQEGGIAGQGLKSQLWGKGRGEKERILLPPAGKIRLQSMPSLGPFFPLGAFQRRGLAGALRARQAMA